MRPKKKVAPGIKKDSRGQKNRSKYVKKSPKEREHFKYLPRLVIVSDGNFTSAWLNGVHIGQGVRRLEFLAEHDGKEAKSIIRIMDMDVKNAEFSTDKNEFLRFMDSMGRPLPFD